MMESPFKGKKNIYLCSDCGHGFVSQDRDAGVTPFMTTCLNCGSMARSMMYAAPQEILADVHPAVTWITPPKNEWGKYTPSTRQHLEKGGLIRSDMLKRKKRKTGIRR